MPMKEKKAETLTVRLTPQTKRLLEAEAERREWTLSKLAEKILSAWVEQRTDGGEAK